SPLKQKIIKEQFEEWEKDGIIEPCLVDLFRNHPVVVPKQDGSHRVCFDYRALNKVTSRAPYPLKRLHEVLDRFRGAVWVSKIDLTSSYLQVPIHPDDRP